MLFDNEKWTNEKSVQDTDIAKPKGSEVSLWQFIGKRVEMPVKISCVWSH